MVVKKVDLGQVLGMSSGEVAALRSAERKLAPRILIMVAAFIAINYIDRSNLSLASIELTESLGLTAATYGLGASLFFVTYVVLQVPSQMVMAYIPRQNLWLALLVAGWGAVAAGMAGMRTIPVFLALRVLLGLFEAGALPGLWSYLAHFYCKERMTVPLSVMMGSLILSQAIGPLLAAGLLSMNGVGGLEGWQWLFLIEGLLAVLCGIAWLWMPADLASVKGLTPEERAALEASFAGSHKPAAGGNQLLVVKRAVTNPVVLVLSAIKCSRDVVLYGLIYWAPLIVKSLLGFSAFGGSNTHQPNDKEKIHIVLMVAIPFAAAALCQFVLAWHSQRTNERRWHTAAVWTIATACLMVLPSALNNFAAGFAVLVLAMASFFAAEGVMVSHFLALQGGEKGIGIAIINSAGAVGGFVGPMLLGYLKEHTGDFRTSMYALGGFMAFSALGIALVNPRWADRWMLKSKSGGGLAAGDCAVDVESDKSAAGARAGGALAAAAK